MIAYTQQSHVLLAWDANGHSSESGVLGECPLVALQYMCTMLGGIWTRFNASYEIGCLFFNMSAYRLKTPGAG